MVGGGVSAVPLTYATAAEVIAGTEAGKPVSPAALASAASAAGGLAQAGKYVRFNAAGALDPTAFDYATAAEVLANTGTGTVNGLVNDDVLAKASTAASAGAADAGKFVKLDTAGKLDPSLLGLDVMEFKGGVDVTAAAPAAPNKGDTYVATTAGTINGSFTGIGGGTAGAGDQLIFDGTNWVQIVGASVVTFSTGAEVVTGTNATKALNPLSLAAAGVVTSAGAADAGKYVRADAGGLIDDTLVPKATSADVTTGTVTDEFLTPASLAGAGVVTSAGAADAGKYVRTDATGLVDDSVVPKATSAAVATGTATDSFITPAGLAGSASAIGGAAQADKYVRFDATGKLDSAVFDYATVVELLGNAGTGTVNGLVNDDILAKASTVVSAGAGDAGKFVKLDATGKISPSVLNLDVMEFKGGVDVTGAAPASPAKGDVYVVTTGGTIAAGFTGAAGGTAAVNDQLIFDGTNWVKVGGASGGATTAAAITSTPAGNLAATDVQAALNELDAEKLALAGGTMAGAIAMGANAITGLANPTAAQDAATKSYVDTAVAFTPSGNIAATTVAGAVAELDSEKVAKSGDTMTGPLVLPADPTLALQAATKQYVDTKVAGPTTSVDNTVARWDGTTGKLIQDSGVYISDAGLTGFNQAVPVAMIDVNGNYAQSTGAAAGGACDCSTSNYFAASVGAATMISFASVPAGRTYSCTVEVNFTAGSVAWPGSVKWPGGTAPTLTAGKTSLFMLVTSDGGVTWYATSLMDY